MNLGQIGSSVIFVLECYQGTIVDLEFDATLSNNFTGATMTIAAGTLGAHGYCALNGPGGGLGPLGVATILS